MRRVVWGLLLTLFSVVPVHAEAQPANKGLFVTPVREYVAVAAGGKQTKSMTIANNTDTPLAVVLSVEQFSVADYTYDYRFTPTTDPWITLSGTSIALQPGKSQHISYTVAPDDSATPGGHYFSLFATATIPNAATPSQVRAATIVYVTVSGQLRATSTVQDARVPRIAFGGDIPFSLDVKNTGNTHFFVYVAGKLEGFSSKGSGAETTHLLLPGTVRSVGSTMPAPLLPGIYTATYGYHTAEGQEVKRMSRIVYVPLWSLLIPFAALWLTVIIVRRPKGFWPRRYK